MNDQELINTLIDIAEVLEIWRGPAGIAVVADGERHLEIQRRLAIIDGLNFVVVEAPEEVPEDRDTDCIFSRSVSFVPTGPDATPIDPKIFTPREPRSTSSRIEQRAAEAYADPTADLPIVYSQSSNEGLLWHVRVADNIELSSIGERINLRAKQLKKKITFVPEWMTPPMRLGELPTDALMRAQKVNEIYERMPGVRGIFVHRQMPTQFAIWLEDSSCVRHFNEVRRIDINDGSLYQLRLIIPIKGQSLISLLPVEWVAVANIATAIHGRCRWCNAFTPVDRYGDPCATCNAEALPTFAIPIRSKSWSRVDVYANPDGTAYVELVAPDAEGGAGVLSKTLRWQLPQGAFFDHLPFGRRNEKPVAPDPVEEPRPPPSWRDVRHFQRAPAPQSVFDPFRAPFVGQPPDDAKEPDDGKKK